MKAIALISGGLDSILAARLIQEQGVEVSPVYFRIPFCSRSAASVFNLEKYLGKPILNCDISADFLKIVESPRHGFGSNLNPCIDCKILMLSRAREMMPQENAQFVVTGEVLAQRPMSQNRQALDTIERSSGLQGLVVRPLSARLLAESLPESKGWIDRRRLLKFSGRQRRQQIELAEKLGVRDYAQPAGGCLLTDPAFAARLDDLVSHKELDLDNVELLKLGRHFRISENAKLAVGRNQAENEAIVSLAKDGDYLFMPDESTAGPTSLGRGSFSQGLIELAAKITCRYCDPKGKDLAILYRRVPGKESSVNVAAADERELCALRL